MVIGAKDMMPGEKKGLRRNVGTVGANLRKQVGADWALQSYPRGLSRLRHFIKLPFVKCWLAPCAVRLTETAELDIV